MARRQLLVFVILLATVPAVAQEPDASFRLKRARACAAALDYECAEAELSIARSHLLELDAATRISVLRLSAETAFASGRKENASAHMRLLLAEDPEFMPPPDAWSSGWKSDLETLRAELPDRRPPIMGVDAAKSARAGETIEVRAKVTDRSGVGKVTLGVGGAFPTRVPMTTIDGQIWKATVPRELVLEPAVPLWLEAFDLNGNGPSRWGSESDPQKIPVGPAPSPPPKPLVKRWWFWTIIGVAAAGTGVGIYYLSKIGRSSNGNDAPGQGRLNVEVQWPSSFD